jgi:hypothetical protein
MRTTETPTQTFLGDIAAITFDAADLGGSRAQRALQQIADALAERRISAVSSVDPAQVALTDEQWTKIVRRARSMASGPSSQW